MRQSSSMLMSAVQQGITNEDNPITSETSSSKSHHHKHSKKRLKTFHGSTASNSDAAALQLSEDEL